MVWCITTGVLKHCTKRHNSKLHLLSSRVENEWRTHKDRRIGLRIAIALENTVSIDTASHLYVTHSHCMQHIGNPPYSPCLMYTAWHRESLKLKEKFGTREGFEIFPNQFFHPITPPPPRYGKRVSRTTQNTAHRVHRGLYLLQYHTTDCLQIMHTTPSRNAQCPPGLVILSMPLCVSWCGLYFCTMKG